MTDTDPIALSALQHWACCPRKCGLIHLQQTFADIRVSRAQLSGRGLKPPMRNRDASTIRVSRAQLLSISKSLQAQIKSKIAPSSPPFSPGEKGCFSISPGEDGMFFHLPRGKGSRGEIGNSRATACAVRAALACKPVPALQGKAHCANYVVLNKRTERQPPQPMSRITCPIFSPRSTARCDLITSCNGWRSAIAKTGFDSCSQRAMSACACVLAASGIV